MTPSPPPAPAHRKRAPMAVPKPLGFVPLELLA
eukprot:CAMPEP_0118929432 /NCGR_PEP_ID=MMETSP1169-20130426/6440_1 /TAXON_ID=36882 /ORGANISM="Pyramimonas obovata, Strain CCMP722" /LENGTH=32 /DNA_ID= /DNA_START= /DNA_END= /DNA_ORIENTATION=